MGGGVQAHECCMVTIWECQLWKVANRPVGGMHFFVNVIPCLLVIVVCVAECMN